MPKEKTYTFGTCSYERTFPPKEFLSGDTSIINVILPFEEALKLNIAVDECVRKMNGYKKSTREGKRAALNLTIHLQTNRIAINEGKLKKE